MSEHLKSVKAQVSDITSKLHDALAGADPMVLRSSVIDAELKAISDGSLSEQDFHYALANSVASSDVQFAYSNILWAWNNNGPCSNFLLCWTYFDSFGVNITFGDGSIAPFAHVYRDGKSAHSCIQAAKDALSANPPNRGLAVEWVMASQIHNKGVFEWLKNHPDAVVQALGSIN